MSQMTQTSASGPAGSTPSKLTTVGILMLINGVLNVLYNIGVGVTLGLSLIAGAIGSAGLGLCCFPLAILPLLPLVLGIFEIVYGAKLLSSTANAPKAGTLKTIAILEICAILFFNAVSLAIGIVNLVLLSDADAHKYDRKA